MSDISNLNKMRAKLFCALLDIWAARMARKDDSDVAEKIGAIAQIMEEIKRLVLAEGIKAKTMSIETDAIAESEKLSCWKTDEHAFNKIRNSIDKFGLKNLPVVRRINRAYQLISGSLHYEACKELNMETMPVFLKDCTTTEAEELALLDAFSKNGLQNLDPRLMNTALRFYNLLLN